MLLSIPAYSLKPTPQCLLLGNGINRLFEEKSWKELINDELETSKSTYKYSDIENMPATMQIVVATNDHVDERMEELASKLLKESNDEEKNVFLRKFFDLPMDDILTANYSFELEIADGMKQSKGAYSHSLKKTKELGSSEEKFRTYQYHQLKNGKRIWHIHGDAAKPSTMMMGHYYYAKQLREIQDCAALTVRRVKSMKEDSTFQANNWIDIFLTSDVYILGFGMYLCESDLWYLACCKKRNFPDTKIYFYEFKSNDTQKIYMMKAYNIQCITGTDLKEDNQKMFYNAAMQDIRDKMEKSKTSYSEEKEEGCTSANEVIALST